MIRVAAVPADHRHPDAIQAARLAPWLSITLGTSGEHCLLSDGWRHIRFDVEEGSLASGEPVILHYRLAGVASAGPQILPLRRLLDLARTGTFSVSLYPPDRRVTRWLLALRVHDALQSGASQREIARVVLGDDAHDDGAARRSDSLRSRVRRLAAEARRLAGGGYRRLMRPS
ncbi:DUF2285 domain-containing protein [Sphingomonas immobilis]|uniref:DUF2285 domain-containing protein n=1 Tax=Sphingomonas immobilis TaxID=3063997 RepID=A0ABT9A174_9SPHN|nr:DUF2285 domain-containing protein [Sphingomonas sp. CA1-15]MDO7843585.1 DUF2285 domain-containing protein [Sphingomonas sp. CA1-15]